MNQSFATGNDSVFYVDLQVVQQIESELRITLTERYPAKQKTTHDEDIVRGWDVIQHEVRMK